LKNKLSGSFLTENHWKFYLAGQANNLFGTNFTVLLKLKAEEIYYDGVSLFLDFSLRIVLKFQLIMKKHAING
jgi:hypothetical protein